MKINISILGFFILMQLYSCTICSAKKINCGAFEDVQFGKWFPYTTNQELVFKSTSTGDTVRYLITNINKSEAYEATQGGFGNNFSGCNSNVVINGYDLPGKNSNFYINYNKTGNTTQTAAISNLEIAFGKGQWTAGTIREAGIDFPLNAYRYTKIDSSYNVSFSNGKLYQVMFILTSDTTFEKSTRPYKLYIAKNTGIIGYDEFPSNKKWVIQ